MASKAQFHGLFIGIDRYKSNQINELSCARRDALALHALFSDTLGGENALLTDEEATKDRIKEEFEALSKCSSGDTVVIAFSGHGSETHELIPHDTDVHDLRGTSIPLDLLQEWFSKIPARRAVLILDCCFSGGIGTKVLKVDVRSRDIQSVEARLEQLAGDGRVIFTASNADQPAWEHGRFGHGFLTYHLLEALRGAEEVVIGGKVSLYRVLEHVTTRVSAAAEQIGRLQTPTMRGSIDGDLIWPVFVAGSTYSTAFPELSKAPLTSDLASLSSVGFPEPLLSAWGESIPSLNELQLSAINDFGVLRGGHLVVSAPTSSGKTMVGELAALRQILERRRALFLFPLKALVADKRRQFEESYGKFGLRTIEATGETDDITPLLRGQYDIGLLTYEKFAAIALTYPHVLAQSGVVVVDEAQMIADESRGANLEFILTLIRMRRREGIEPQIIALSAVIGDTNGLERWLDARLLRRTARPVPLAEGILRGDGSFRFLDPDTGEERIELDVMQRQYGKGSSQDWIIPLVGRLVDEEQQVIVFRETKGEARGCANYLAKSLELPPAEAAVERLPAGDPSKASVDLVEALRRGVAFHNSDLDREERRVIEEEFRLSGSGLRVIAATTTLAMGVNTPASTVVIAGLEHPGNVPYSVAEYKNLVGRAGRLGYSERGTSYLLALDPRTEHDLWNRYVTGQPENLVSRFLDPNTDPRSLIVRVLVAAQRAAGEGVTRDDVIHFLEASFGAYLARQSRDGWQWDRQAIVAALADLESHGLVERDADEALHLTDLGRLSGESATEVESIIRLVNALGRLGAEDITDPVLIAAAQVTMELDQVHFPINRRSTQKEPQVWPAELRRQGVPADVLRAFQRFALDDTQATLRAKKAVACLLYVSGEAMNDIEATLTQFGGAFGGAAGPIRAVTARTSDLLPTTARVAEILHPELDLGDRVGRIVLRLTHGIRGQAVDLARQLGNQLLRADYCRLVAANLVEHDTIDLASDASLLECLDGDRAKLSLVQSAAVQIEYLRKQAAETKKPILSPYEA